MYRRTAPHQAPIASLSRAAVPLVCAATILLGCAPAPLDQPGAETGSGAETAETDDTMLTPLDASRLDRSVDEGPCGFPSAGPNGYGTQIGERLENNVGFPLVDCDGNPIELAQFFCPRTEGEQDFNRGVLINIGAGWCGPCLEETLEFPEVYEEFHSRGIEIVQIMFQDWNAQAPTKSFCTDWKTGQWVGGDVGVELSFPVGLDQLFDWTSIYLQDPQSATPVNLLVDANGNIRWKLEGQKPKLDNLRAQFELVLGDPYGATD